MTYFAYRGDDSGRHSSRPSDPDPEESLDLPQGAPSVSTGSGARRRTGVTRDVLTHGRLFASLVRSDFVSRYRGATFGFLWAVALPLLQSAVLIIVFTRVRGIGSAPNYEVYVLSGMVLWGYMNQTLTAGSTAIVAGAGLVDKVRFPLILLPLVPVVAGTIYLAINVLIVTAVGASSGSLEPGRIHLLLTAASLAAFISTGLAAGLALLHVWFRDVGYAVTALTTVWFYATPVFYELEILGSLESIARWNPMVGVLDLGRAAFDVDSSIASPGLVSAIGIGCVSWAVAAAGYRRYELDVADQL